VEAAQYGVGLLALAGSDQQARYVDHRLQRPCRGCSSQGCVLAEDLELAPAQVAGVVRMTGIAQQQSRLVQDSGSCSKVSIDLSGSFRAGLESGDAVGDRQR